MKILGIVCGPRLRGNTEIILQESLDAAQEEGAEIELVTLAGKTIMPCDSCLSCDETKECRIKDDMQDIYIELLEADGIIFGTEDSRLVAVNFDGGVIWNQHFSASIYTSPVEANGTILVVSNNPEQLLIALDSNGVQKWTFFPEN